jgi:hypothetical protein
MFLAAFQRKWWKSKGSKSEAISLDQSESTNLDKEKSMSDEKNDTLKRFSEDDFNAEQLSSDDQGLHSKWDEASFNELEPPSSHFIDEDMITSQINEREDSVYESRGELPASRTPKKPFQANQRSRSRRRDRVEEEEDLDDEVFTNINNDDDIEQLDPLGPAYDLEKGTLLGSDDDSDMDENKVRVDVTSAKDFFNSELLYRFDLLRDQERDILKGRYRMEIRGSDGGVWTLTLDKEVKVVPVKEEADLVLMMHHDDFLSVVNGKINPQVALASQRIKISGDSRKASLFQNILAPRID